MNTVHQWKKKQTKAIEHKSLYCAMDCSVFSCIYGHVLSHLVVELVQRPKITVHESLNKHYMYITAAQTSKDLSGFIPREKWNSMLTMKSIGPSENNTSTKFSSCENVVRPGVVIKGIFFPICRR